jgi:hypothetical protein
MLDQNLVDKKSLRILLKYNELANFYRNSGCTLSTQKQEYVEKFGTSPVDFMYIKSHGLAYDIFNISHDEAIELAEKNYLVLNKKSVTNLFLASLSSGRADYRAGLGAYAFMQTQPKHMYRPNKAGVCDICSGEERNMLDLTALNSARFRYGGMIACKTPYQLFFFLQQQASLKDQYPTELDFVIFNEIITLANNAEENLTPLGLVKLIKDIPGFKADKEQCRLILETLGFCSILESEEHVGYLRKYTNPGTAPSKSHSSNWAYPVDFWVGRNRVKPDALAFWFGEYDEIITL